MMEGRDNAVKYKRGAMVTVLNVHFIGVQRCFNLYTAGSAYKGPAQSKSLGISDKIGAFCYAFT